MNTRLINPSAGEEIQIIDLRQQGDWFVGKIAFIKCRGATLVLFHELESLANSNVVPEAERISEEIDNLGFLAEGLPGARSTGVCKRLQVMNGDDVVFQVSNHS